MFIANLLYPKLFIAKEEIITQGQEANEMYIISRGSVDVHINFGCNAQRPLN